MFRKAEESRMPKDETNNDPVLAKGFWEEYIHITVKKLCKRASTSDEDPTKCVDLGYEYAVMQKLMNFQLKDPEITPTKREIRARAKAQLQRLIPNIAKNEE